MEIVTLHKNGTGKKKIRTGKTRKIWVREKGVKKKKN